MDKHKTTFAGLELSTPFIVGSGPINTSIGEIKNYASRMAENDWSCLVTKTIVQHYGTQLRPHLWSTSQYRFLGMQNSGPALNQASSELFKKLAEDVQEAHRCGLRVIASLMGSSFPDWQQLAQQAADTGADALELNLSCPSPREGVVTSLGGLRVGQNPELSAEIVEKVAAATRIPVIVKLPPIIYDAGTTAQLCRKAGAAGVALINTLPGIIGVDIETLNPYASDMLGTGFSTGLSGPLVKPLALRLVHEVARSSEIEICGIGGIVRWQDPIEYFLLGASAVQVVTGVMWYGLQLGKELQKGLSQYMRRKGYNNLAEFRGATVPRVTNTIPESYPPLEALVDREKCNTCGLCLTACWDNSYGAIHESNGAVEIDREKCIFCGLCAVVCRRGAITFSQNINERGR